MSTSFDPNIPADTDTVYDAYFSFRRNMLSLNNLIQQDHVSGTEAGLHGRHKQVTFVSQDGKKVAGLLNVVGSALAFNNTKVDLSSDWVFYPMTQSPEDPVSNGSERGGLTMPCGFSMKWITDIVPQKNRKSINMSVTGINISEVNFATCFMTSVTVNNKFTFSNISQSGLQQDVRYYYEFDLKNGICHVSNQSDVAIGALILVMGKK